MLPSSPELLKRNRLAIFVSTLTANNARAMINATLDKECPFKVSVVITNNPQSAVVAHADKFGIPCVVIPHRGKSQQEFEREVLTHLGKFDADLLVMLGFYRIWSKAFVDEVWHVRKIPIVNLHNALLQKYPDTGGPGMYGDNVHAHVLQKGYTESGCTVHLITSDAVDRGPILRDYPVKVLPDDTVATLRHRIGLHEHVTVKQVVMDFAQGLVGYKPLTEAEKAKILGRQQWRGGDGFM